MVLDKSTPRIVPRVFYVFIMSHSSVKKLPDRIDRTGAGRRHVAEKRIGRTAAMKGLYCVIVCEGGPYA